MERRRSGSAARERTELPTVLPTEAAEQSGRPSSTRSPTRAGRRPQFWSSESQNNSFNQSQERSDAQSSWSMSSDEQLGHDSPGPPDRVFPIRSVISVDPTQTSFNGPLTRPSEDHEGFPGMSMPSGAATIAAADVAEAQQNVRSRPRPASPRSSTSTPTRAKSARSSLDAQRPTTLGFAPPHESRIPTSEGHKGHHAAASIATPRGESEYGGGRRMQMFSDTESLRSRGESQEAADIGRPGRRRSSTSDTEGIGNIITARFKHIVTEHGHAVITGRDGETLQRCEDEPIHIPGAVQGFGLLIALQEDTEGRLIVRIVSENSKMIIGYTPDELFKLESFTDILSEEQSENLLDHIDYIRDDDADPGATGPEVFTISIKLPAKSRSTKLWCAMHVNPSNTDSLICEFELDDDQVHPPFPPNEDTPEPAEDTLDSQPTQEEFAESTQNMSKPLRVLRSARKRRGEAAAMEVFNILSQVQEQLASAPNLDQFLKILVGVVKELTGFHRVMIYQFDSTFNGRVVTELVDPRATKDLYKGLNFPASDIPKQARELYKINKVRLLYDRDLTTARLVCRTLEDLEKPLDLSFSYLRAMSPIHVKYLANMAVRSSMSISINAFNELWGLISCHGYGSKGMRVSFPIRKMCRLVGDTASRNIERLSYASRLQARKLINTVPTEANPSGYIIASSDDLLKLFDADFGLLSIRGETKVLGKLEHSQEALAMLEYLRLRKVGSVMTSQDIKADFPDLRYRPGFQVIAGLLLVPLSVGGSDFIVFFRRGQVKEVKWAGNPYEKFVREGTEGYLEPRKSFKTWSETVIGKCREWTEEQIETAAVLCLVYGKFIEVWRQKEAALQSSQLTKLLLANSAHEVRTPLNAIINYLEIALEGALDHETRENLAKSHSASKSLIYVINDLLDLTKTEEGRELIKYEVFDLPATVQEATDQFTGDAKRKGIEYNVIVHPGIPQYVHGDQQKVRQVVSNVTANAMQHTTTGWIKVELCLVACEGRQVVIDIVVQDSGAGMSDKQLDILFRDLEQVSSEESDDLLPNLEAKETRKGSPPSAERRTLGLGLAVVSRIVRNMEGHLRLKSKEGKGSRFVIQLPFQITNDDPPEANLDEPKVPSLPASLIGSVHAPPSATEGEVMLVDSLSPAKVDILTRKKSFDDTNSLSSVKSGSSGKSKGSQRSDVDRLIDAISGPLGAGRPQAGEMLLTRSSSTERTSSTVSAGGPARLATSQVERPDEIKRARSLGAVVPEYLRSPHQGPSGSEFITDNKTLLKAIRMPDDSETTSVDRLHGSPQVLLDSADDSRSPARIEQAPQKQHTDHLEVLVAEDDPVNSRIIIKRMEKAGHRVHHTVNGEECASVYGERPFFFDVVLMDMQMPIVDGLTATKMIRSFEKQHNQNHLSLRARQNGRVPVFAVSASLVERERQTYVNAGFDGWVLKPIDFKRLSVLLLGIVDEKIRNESLYVPGEWERGGWFEKRQPNLVALDSAPSKDTPVTYEPIDGPEQPSGDLSSESSGRKTPTPIGGPPEFWTDDNGSVAVEHGPKIRGRPDESRSKENVGDHPDA
ncbi:MAG: hypothetical protein M1818_006069 [Claussenomyces sp. TS43310]|nr:MAG: hypothetical protein M1818_006069 [Claussenomyces sp. TS43310]